MAKKAKGKKNVFGSKAKILEDKDSVSKKEKVPPGRDVKNKNRLGNLGPISKEG